jgi:hypothetical protein
VGDSWSALLKQAFGLLTQETADSQFAAVIGVLILLALIVEGISSLFFRRRRSQSQNQLQSAKPAPAERHGSPAFKWQPVSLPRASKSMRKRRVRNVRPARLFRPNLKRTGMPGALAQSENMTMPMAGDMGAEDMRAEDTSAPASPYDLPPSLEPLLETSRQPMMQR